MFYVIGIVMILIVAFLLERVAHPLTRRERR